MGKGRDRTHLNYSVTDDKIELKDLKLICKDCGDTFIFTAEDQKFYAKQGFTNAPARCKTCREEFQKKKYKGQELVNVKCFKCKKVGKIVTKPSIPNKVLCADCFVEELDAERSKYGSLPATLSEAMERIGKKTSSPVPSTAS